MRQLSKEKEHQHLLELLYYDEKKGINTIGDTDWVLISGQFFRDLFLGIEEILDTGASVIWLCTGKKAGINFVKSIINAGNKPEDISFILDRFFTDAGWGKIETKIDFDQMEAAIEIKNSVTTRGIESDQPVCHLIRGFIEGAFEVLFEELTECIETKCAGKGDSICEFIVKTKNNSKNECIW